MDIVDHRRALLPLRGFYFFNFAALGALFPFLPLLLSSRGMSPDEIRWVMVLIPLSSLIVPPIWGSLSDSLRARLPLLRLACLGSCLTSLLLLVSSGFWGHLAAVGILSLFRAPLSSLGDATAYAALGGRRANFSKVRVWGSVGFALFVLVPGLAQGAYQIPIVVVTTSIILLSAGLSTLPLEAPALKRERRILAQTAKILLKPAVLLVLLSSAFYYTAHAMYDAWFSLHLRQIGHSDWFIGTAWSIGVVAEITLMLLAPRFIHRVGSSTLLTLCAAVAAGRWAALSVAVDHLTVLLSQLLHAITFGLWYLSLVKFAQERAPAHLRTSLQSFAAAFMGFGMVCGYLAGGEAMARGSGPLVFRVAALVASGALVLYVVALLAQRLEAAPIDEDDETP